MVYVIKFQMKDLVRIALERQKQKYDCNIVFSGPRGNGKSTGLFKFFHLVGGFKPWKQQVYTRKDVMKLLEDQKYGKIFDDEAIRSSYKRNFQDSDQKLLIQMLNMYRDNFNIYGMAIPSFYSLDKDLRSLIKIHVHVIERGVGVIHVANEGVLYSDDSWGVKYNKKLEENWEEKKKRNPNFSPPYEKLSTFKGYLTIPDLGVRQRELYEKIKVEKRKEVYEQEMKKEGSSSNGNLNVKELYDKLLINLKNYELDKDMLMQFSILHDLNYSNVLAMLNKRLLDSRDPHRATHYLSHRRVTNNSKVITKNVSDVQKSNPVMLKALNGD